MYRIYAFEAAPSLNFSWGLPGGKSLMAVLISTCFIIIGIFLCKIPSDYLRKNASELTAHLTLEIKLFSSIQIVYMGGHRCHHNEHIDFST